MKLKRGEGGGAASLFTFPNALSNEEGVTTENTTTITSNKSGKGSDSMYRVRTSKYVIDNNYLWDQNKRETQKLVSLQTGRKFANILTFSL